MGVGTRGAGTHAGTGSEVQERVCERRLSEQGPMAVSDLGLRSVWEWRVGKKG